VGDPFARVMREAKAKVPLFKATRRRVRALYELTIGCLVYQPGETVPGMIVNISYRGSQTGCEKKWCWLKYGTNTYVKLSGSQALYTLELDA